MILFGAIQIKLIKLKIERRDSTLHKKECIPIVGVDISPSSVRVLQLKCRDGQYHIIGGGQTSVAMLSDECKGAQDDFIVSAISEGVKAAKVNAHHAVCSVSGNDVSVKGFMLPCLPEKEIQGAVEFEAAQTLAVDTMNSKVAYHLYPDHVIDNILNDPDKDDIGGVMVIASNKSVDRTVKLVESAKLNCAIVDAESVALLNCFESIENDLVDQTIFIVHMGETKSHLIIHRPNTLPFFREMSVGFNTIIELIAEELDETFDNIKRFLNDHEAQREAGVNINVSFSRACQDWIGELMSTIRSYYYQNETAEIDQILLCGEISMIDGIDEMLDVQLPMPVALWNPLEKMTYDKKNLDVQAFVENGTLMNVAVGLAIREI